MKRLEKPELKESEFETIIKSINMPFSHLSKSYTWENESRGARTTFSEAFWIDAIMDYLYFQKSPGKIEEDYLKRDPNRRTRRPTKNMYISTLLRRMLIKKNSQKDCENLQKYSYPSVVKHIEHYVTKVIFQYAPEKQKDSWRDELITRSGFISNPDQKVENYEKFIEKWQLEATPITKKDNLLAWNAKTEKSIEEEHALNAKEMEHYKIGILGEEIVCNYLRNVKKVANVIWEHEKNRKFSRFDISYVVDNTTRYVEVKSSTSTNEEQIRYFISRQEVEFARNCGKNYEIFFVTGILRGKYDSWILPKISYVSSPNFLIDEIPKKYNDLSITPSKYMGVKNLEN